MGKYILHRIIKKTEQGFVTAGDGNLFKDGIVVPCCIKGVAVKIIRKGREIDCRSFWWKSASFIWIVGFPVRKWMLKTVFLLGKYKSKKN